jgi:leucyl/phenylalanyl-tRNA--protein transferase
MHDVAAPKHARNEPAMSAPLDPRLLLQGYAAGIFPMADSRDADDIFWVEPRHRAILPLDRFHCSRSLARRLRSGCFTVTCDAAFDAVVLACADRGETWINGAIEVATRNLHAAGHAHSVECWRTGADGTRELVGGLYGVKLGRAFFGESMFSRATDASKVALAWLVARMKAGGFVLLDCQFMTDHLASLGAVEVRRSTYVALLGSAIGSGAAAGGASTGAGAGFWARPGAAEAEAPPHEFGALDRLLDAAGAAGAPGASGHFIAQLLGHTS